MDATSILVGLLLGAALAAPAGFLLAKSMLASRHAGSDALLEQSRRESEASRATIERLRSEQAKAERTAADAVALDLPAGLAVRADADLLARAIGNLLRNALRYAGRDAAITLRAYRVDTSVELVVDDTGPGVPPEALARLGEPFFRPEIARQRETGGAGLGLAIVRACVEACGGGVHFANRDPRGFRASIRLPLAD
jgi:two-component system sensor histidine kinase CpxA